MGRGRRALLHRVLAFLRHPRGVRAQTLDRPPAPRIRRPHPAVRLADDRHAQPLRARPQRLPHPLRIGSLRLRFGIRTPAGRHLRKHLQPFVAAAQARTARTGRRHGEAARRAERLVPRPAGAHRLGGQRLQQHPGHPARDKQAVDAAHGLVRHAHTPLLQDPAIAPGRGLHHPRGVARLRHGRRRGARRGAAQLHVGADGRDRPRQRLRDFVQPPLEDQRPQGPAREPRRDHRPFGRHGPFALAPPPLRSAAERHARRPDPLLLHGTHPHRIPAPDAHRTVGHAVVRLKTKEMGNDWTKDFGFAREEIFRSEETLRTIRHIRASWGCEPEFLWEKFPDYAVFRRQDNAKWYAVILTVQAGKLGLADEGRTEILDIRADAETMARALDFEHYFPGYHMNKRTWLTVRLDGNVPFGEIAPLIARSYELAGKK